jgi:hypothetical protein
MMPIRMKRLMVPLDAALHPPIWHGRGGLRQTTAAAAAEGRAPPTTRPRTGMSRATRVAMRCIIQPPRTGLRGIGTGRA